MLRREVPRYQDKKVQYPEQDKPTVSYAPNTTVWTCQRMARHGENGGRAFRMSSMSRFAVLRW